jgi:hypothetical protein
MLPGAGEDSCRQPLFLRCEILYMSVCGYNWQSDLVRRSVRLG